MVDVSQLVSKRIEITDSFEEINEYYYRHGWTDGLPIIPPTGERVEKMLSGTIKKPQDVIGELAPNYSEATVEKIAVNAVMAGCLSHYMPVIIAAVEAMIEEQFNLYAMVITTHPANPLLIVNGPIRKELEINSGYNVFGQGARANATIGRALRLIQVNIGGGIPGKVDRATQGSPAKFSFCIAENEEKNPWQPLHVERGFAPSVSTVTMLMAENPHNIQDEHSTNAQGIMTTLAGSVKAQGSNNVFYQSGEVLLVLCPEHAATLAEGGLSKQDIRHYLWENARIPKSEFPPERQTGRFSAFKDDALIPITAKESDIMIIVAGGAGKHSAYCPNFGLSRSVTRQIQR